MKLFSTVLLAFVVFVLADPSNGFTEGRLPPYEEVCPGLSLARRLARKGDVEGALEALKRLKERHPERRCERGSIPDEAIDLEAATILEHFGRLREAVEYLRRLEKGVLSDYALFREGMDLSLLGNYGEARASLAKVSRYSGPYLEARLNLALALLEEQRVRLARPLIGEVLSGDLNAIERAMAQVTLAKVLLASGEKEEAIDHLLTVYLRSPEGSWRSQAKGLLAEVGRPVGALENVLRKVILRDRDWLQQAARMGPNMAKRYAELDQGLPELVRGCGAFYGRRDFPSAAAHFSKASDNASSPLVKALALELLAKAYERLGNSKEATRVLRQLQDESFGHLTKVRAMVAEARLALSIGQTGRALKILSTVANDKESGFAFDALWLSALSALVAGESEKAVEGLGRLKEILAYGDGLLYGNAEKIEYFLGVALLQAGLKAQGLARLNRVAEGYPHSYYSVLALSRLKDLGEAKEVEAGEKGPWPEEGKWPKLEPDERIAGPVILWRLGLKSEAIAELQARARGGRLKGSDPLFLAAMVLDKKGNDMLARRYLRGKATPETWPLFAALYPRPYRDLVSEVLEALRPLVEGFGVDEALIYAVMRVESRFNPRARSRAGAVGLMQLMPTTARIVARRLFGDPRLAARLYLPSANIRLGAGLLAALGRHFRSHHPLMLAGYVAGAGAARRFYKALKGLSSDLFVEVIPFDSTVSYIKQVIGLSAGYRAIYLGRTTKLPLSLPDSLGPFLEPLERGPLALLR